MAREEARKKAHQQQQQSLAAQARPGARATVNLNDDTGQMGVEGGEEGAAEGGEEGAAEGGEEEMVPSSAPQRMGSETVAKLLCRLWALSTTLPPSRKPGATRRIASKTSGQGSASSCS